MTEAGHTALDPQAMTLWRREGLLATAPVALIAIAATVGVAFDDGPAIVVGLVGLIVTALAVAFALWFPARLYTHWSYRLDDVAIEIRHGALIRRRSVIPYFRVQHVDSAAGPLERGLGLMQLKVHTASSGTDAKIPGLAEDVATELRRLIIARAGLSDGV